MKKQLFSGLVLMSVVILSGCTISIGGDSNDDKSSENAQKGESQDNQSNDSSNNEDNSNESGIKDESNITEQQSIAMAMLDPSVEDDIVTGDELLSGKYTQTFGAGEKKERNIDTLELAESPELNKMKNKPNGMKFYSLNATKGSYATIVGVNKDEVVYIKTQSAVQDFNDVIDNGTVDRLNIADLYKKYKDNRKVSNVASKIEYVDPLPSSDDDSDEDNNSNENVNSDEYYAKVWLTALPSYRNMDESEMNAELEFNNLEGEYLNPYNKANTVKYPKGVYRLAGYPTAAGHVVYKNNGDGTISIYNVPSHFHDERWTEDDNYSQKESEKILNNPKVVKLYDASDEQIERTVKMFDGSSSMDDDVSDEDSNSEKVTRENVIDKVESYEGETLDTDKYTFKEPEKTDEGKWGFSFEDKDGNLAGSYIIDDDGKVTEYDEDGEEVGSGY